jgi:hypothetical protein
LTLQFQETEIIDKTRISEGYWCYILIHYQGY